MHILAVQIQQRGKFRGRRGRARSWGWFWERDAAADWDQRKLTLSLFHPKGFQAGDEIDDDNDDGGDGSGSDDNEEQEFEMEMYALELDYNEDLLSSVASCDFCIELAETAEQYESYVCLWNLSVEFQIESIRDGCKTPIYEVIILYPEHG